MFELLDGSWKPVAENLRRTASARGRRQLRSCSLEGTRVHERALAAGMILSDVLVTQRYAASGAREIKLLTGLARTGCKLHLVPEDAMNEFTMGRTFGDIVGLAAVKEPGALNHESEIPGDAIFLVGQDIRDPGNVGALVRTALALGAGAFVGLGSGDPWHPKAVRTAMGSVFRLPCYRYDNSQALLQTLRELGFTLVGTVLEQGVPLPGWSRPPGRLALFMGSEAFGLSDQVIRGLDARVTIPMIDNVDSLSVNAAASAAMYALRFQNRED